MADQEGANNGADMDNDEQDVARATAEVAVMQDGNNARRAAGAVGAFNCAARVLSGLGNKKILLILK
jgi:hypothetical protein